MLGLIGGLSYHSTLFYYEGINQLVFEKYGGFHSAEMLLYSFNFAQIVAWQDAKELHRVEAAIHGHGLQLAEQGCHSILVCSNTMHAFTTRLEQEVGPRFIHIADTVAENAQRRQLRRPLLLGTSFTMERTFYRDRLMLHGLPVVVPDRGERQKVHQMIYRNLVNGKVKPEFITDCAALAEKYRVTAGCDSIILGCTELRMVFPEPLLGMALIDSCQTHVETAAARVRMP
jgi:aspartate racemase